MPGNLEAVFFDVDGVLTEYKSSWDYIHRKLGVTEEAQVNYDLFLQGRISYEDWMLLDTKLWVEAAGGRLHKDELYRILSEIPIRKGARELVSWLHRIGVKVALVSLGVEPLVARVAREVGADVWMAPRLRYDKRGYLIPGGIPVPAPGSERGKGWAVKRLAMLLGVSLSRSAYVGDSVWDADAFRVVGYPIGFGEDHSSIEGLVKCHARDFEELRRILEEIIERGSCVSQ
ncbi:MAG: HAD-IB family phosphatase [Desulfurococcales archaeon]|nr:HAD-IB family phosphatase [Desulfurococcales archaeon]